MRNRTKFMISAAMLLAFTAVAADQPVKTVPKLDVKRYMGVWHEIAAIPQWFQKDCAWGTTAAYTLRSDGDVDVLNQCRTAEGRVKKAEAIAWVVDPQTNAKLKVSFIPGKFKVLGGDYWVLDLGPDYEYAVVGDSTREYGWVLARQPELPKETLDGIWARLKAQGYDVTKFKRTAQTPCQAAGGSCTP